MLLSKVSAGAKFSISGKGAPNLPIFVTDEGTPHRPLNAYLRYRLLDENKDIKTVRDKDALHISSFLNYLYQQVPKDDLAPIEYWRRATHGKLLWFQRLLEKEGLIPDVRNQYIQSIYSFYWFCEQRRFCEGVIGINDSAKKNYEYPLYVFGSLVGSKRHFRIPLLERVTKRMRLNVGTPDDWDSALSVAFEGGSAFHERDELMLRLVRESNLRRDELAHLQVSQFAEYAKGVFMSFPLHKDKNSKRRFVKVNIELYRDIQSFIENTRSEFIVGKNDAGYLFTGMNRDGKHFSPSYINEIFAKYKVKPHDGRSVALTERFVELIRTGVDKQTAMMLVSQEAGHSLSGKGKTLEQHYLQAQAIFNNATYDPVGAMKVRLLKQNAEIERLKAMLVSEIK